ncbi:hypothetical protein Tco_1383766 [Tanacetum coccineum]
MTDDAILVQRALTEYLPAPEIDYDGQQGTTEWDVIRCFRRLVGMHRVHCDLAFISFLRSYGNLPLIRLDFEELELDRRELDKQEVEQPELSPFSFNLQLRKRFGGGSARFTLAKRLKKVYTRDGNLTKRISVLGSRHYSMYHAEAYSEKSMMWTCPKKIIKSIPCFVKRLIKSLLKSRDFISKICGFGRREKFVDEFGNKIIPCLNRSRGFSLAKSGLHPSRENGKSKAFTEYSGTFRGTSS